MVRLRPARRLLVIGVVFFVLLAIISNIIIFVSLTGNGWVKFDLKELKYLAPQYGHFPGFPKKPWHAGEKVEEPLEPVDNHPIAALMQEADNNFLEYEETRSKSFKETVHKYRHKYGRHPPPGFREWYKYARSRNVHNIDDFEQIMDDLRPFWAVEPRIIRNLAANMWRDKEDQGVSGIFIRNHKIAKEANKGWRSDALVTLIKKFVKYLPDMDIAMNRLDQPRVVVPWEEMQKLLRKEIETRRTPPEVWNSYTTKMEGLLKLTSEEDEDTIAEDDDSPKEDPGWYPWHGKQYMEVVKTACPPDSPAASNETNLAEADHLYKTRLGGLVTNYNLSTDLCTVGPQLADKHGLLYSSSTMIPTKRLVPIFGECKVNVNSDILFPANMYWLEDERYDYDGKFDHDWEDKKDVMIWRGVTSGGVQTAENWRRMHRQRLVLGVNATVMEGKEVRILTEQPEMKGEYENYRDFHPSAFVAEHTDVGFTETPGCNPNCDFYEDQLSMKEGVKLPEQFKNKFLVDIDGHSFSGRWHAFLESKALGMKATIFREWHDSRLFAWRHFVPMDNRYDDVYTLLTYFLGVGTPPEQRVDGIMRENDKAYVARHDTEGKRIADQGREWAKKVLRREDIEVRSLMMFNDASLTSLDLHVPTPTRVWSHYRRQSRPHRLLRRWKRVGQIRRGHEY